MPWYKRRRTLVIGVILLIAAVTVVTDLPQNASRGVQVGSDTTVVNSVNASVKSCAFAVHESLGLYGEEKTDKLTASERAQVPSLLGDDQAACSFTNDDIYTLSNIEVPGSAAGKYLERLVGTVTTWATSDALAAIEAIQTLWASPSDAKAVRALGVAEKRLIDDRTIALTDVQAADKVLKAHLPALGLPAVRLTAG
ncbi:MAG: hypothetical protein ACLQK4_03660 [Acidimicrobiales bacterium]